MADLTEDATFPSGIYQIEVTDPVLGGPPDLSQGLGISNVAAQQLARRTNWLRALLVAAGTGQETVSALVDCNAITKGGFYSGTNPQNGPGGTITLLHLPGTGSTTATQFAIGAGSDRIWWRRKTTGIWLGWITVWHAGRMGAGTGLDADMLDGVHLDDLLRRASNLSDLESYSTARTNLGLGSMATQAQGTGASAHRTNSEMDDRYATKGTGSLSVRNNTELDVRYLRGANNLSDLLNIVTARTNLGLGSMATQAQGTGASAHRTNSEMDDRYATKGTGSLSVRNNTELDVRYLNIDAHPTAGAIRAYALARNVSSVAFNTGDIVLGGNLRFSDTSGQVGGELLGTWRCMSFTGAGNTGLFRRIA